MSDNIVFGAVGSSEPGATLRICREPDTRFSADAVTVMVPGGRRPPEFGIALFYKTFAHPEPGRRVIL